MARLISCEIPAGWDHVRSLRKDTRLRLAPYGQTLSRAGAMVGSELADNAVRHGERLPGSPSGAYVLEECGLQAGAEIRITVLSRCGRPDVIERLAARLQRIRDEPDRRALYEERALELLGDPDLRGGLGLYRIACEGGFSLHHRYSNGLLTVIASRQVEA
jgi:hypothetical protein